MNLVEKVDINGLIRKHESDYYYKSFKTRTQLFTMLFGILSRCDSMTEICEGLRAMGGKLNHLGVDQAPAKSTACDGLRNRSHEFFEDLYFTLVRHYQSFLSDSRTFGLTFKEVLLIDSTTIRLFSDILKGVGRNPKGDGKKKGGLKVHMLVDAVQSVGRFIKITQAKVHDQYFLKSLELISHSMIVFDRAYNYYHQFALWTQRDVYFVTRMKKSAVFTVIKVLRTHYRKKGQAKVLGDEIIEMEYNPEDESGKKNTRQIQKLRLRRVRYQDDQNRYYEFLSNNFEITAEEIAFLYKKRWGIGVSSEGHITQSVKVRPGSGDSSSVAWEAPPEETKAVKPSDIVSNMGNKQHSRLQRAVNAEVASLHLIPVAETVDNVRKQQELSEKSLMRQFSPAGYQRWHGVKGYVETGEALDTRRRNIAEKAVPITLSGKWDCRYQGDGSGRSTDDRHAAKRAGREGPGLMSNPYVQFEAGVR